MKACIPEHLADLVVPEGGVGVVHDDDQLDPGVGHVAKNLSLITYFKYRL